MGKDKSNKQDMFWFPYLSTFDLQKAWRCVSDSNRQDSIAEECIDGCGFSVWSATEEDDFHVITAEDLPYGINLKMNFALLFYIGILIILLIYFKYSNV